MTAFAAVGGGRQVSAPSRPIGRAWLRIAHGAVARLGFPEFDRLRPLPFPARGPILQKSAALSN